MMILNSVIWTLVIGYIHACNGGEPLTELLYWPQSQSLQLNLHKTGREPVLGHHGWRGGYPGGGSQAFGGERGGRNESELSWDIWHTGERLQKWNLIRMRNGTILGLPHWRSKPLHNLESSRRQQWKWGECFYMHIIICTEMHHYCMCDLQRNIFSLCANCFIGQRGHRDWYNTRCGCQRWSGEDIFSPVILL